MALNQQNSLYSLPTTSPKYIEFRLRIFETICLKPTPNETRYLISNSWIDKFSIYCYAVAKGNKPTLLGPIDNSDLYTNKGAIKTKYQGFGVWAPKSAWDELVACFVPASHSPISVVVPDKKRGSKSKSKSAPSRKKQTVPSAPAPSAPAPSAPAPSAPATASVQVVKGIRGIQNRGTTCFMSAGLQCLNQVEDLAQASNCWEYNSNSSHLTNGEVLKAYTKIARQFRMTSIYPISLSDFNTVAGSAGIVHDAQQNDAEEFVHQLLNRIHKELNTIVFVGDPIDNSDTQYSHPPGNFTPVSSPQQAYALFKAVNSSFIVDQFFGQEDETTNYVCNRCGPQTAHIYTIIRIMQLPAQTTATASLEGCINDYQHPAQRQGTCDICGRKVRKTTNVQFTVLPPTLILHLNQDLFHSNVKTRNRFPTRGLQIQDQYQTTHTYNLIGVVNHWGTTPIASHFTPIQKRSVVTVNTNLPFYQKVPAATGPGVGGNGSGSGDGGSGSGGGGSGSSGPPPIQGSSSGASNQKGKGKA
ncbi:Ubiquitin carboxyl-terminal hydrolase 2 [Mortierella sp. AD094]|nr:Ubiquitin carboxyl-terminal hydrolase 2 [Mortierella sp. AD094]